MQVVISLDNSAGAENMAVELLALIALLR